LKRLDISLCILSSRLRLSGGCLLVLTFSVSTLVNGFVKLILCSYKAGSVYKNILCMLSANSDVLLHLGVSGLFSGFGWLAFGRVFGIGARFGVYEILTAYCKGKVF
jgi:hypothetical protein